MIFRRAVEVHILTEKSGFIILACLGSQDFWGQLCALLVSPSEGWIWFYVPLCKIGMIIAKAFCEAHLVMFVSYTKILGRKFWKLLSVFVKQITEGVLQSFVHVSRGSTMTGCCRSLLSRLRWEQWLERASTAQKKKIITKKANIPT